MIDRDECAIAAMQGILAGGYADTVPHDDRDAYTDVATFAYSYAEAMMEERRKRYVDKETELHPEPAQSQSQQGNGSEPQMAEFLTGGSVAGRLDDKALALAIRIEEVLMGYEEWRTFEMGGKDDEANRRRKRWIKAKDGLLRDVRALQEAEVANGRPLPGSDAAMAQARADGSQIKRDDPLTDEEVTARDRDRFKRKLEGEASSVMGKPMTLVPAEDLRALVKAGVDTVILTGEAEGIDLIRVGPARSEGEEKVLERFRRAVDKLEACVEKLR